MGALFTIHKNLVKPDYMDGIIQTVKQKTPLLTMLKRGKKPTGWAQEVEVEGALTPENLAAAEGSDFNESNLDYVGTKVLKHQLQMFKSIKGYHVTEESEELPSHNESGTNAALARQIRIDAQRTLLSIENTLGSEQEAVERGTATNTVPKTRGIASWLAPLDTTLETAALLHPVQAIPTEFIPATGFAGDVTDASAFNQEVFSEMLTAAALQAGDDDVSLVFLCGLKLKKIMSMWSFKAQAVTGVQVLWQRDQRKPRADEFICDEFAFDGATVRTVTDNHLFADTTTMVVGTAGQYSGVCIKPEFWSIDTLVPLKKHDLVNKGGGPRGFHKATLRLGCVNPVGQFRVKYVAPVGG